MTFNFTYENEKQKRELEEVIREEGSRFEYEIYYCKIEPSSLALFIPVEEYFQDIEKAKAKILEEQKQNKWHDLRVNPNDLPKNYGEDWVLVKLKDAYDSFISNLPHIAELRGNDWFTDDFNNTQLCKETCGMEVIAWKEIESKPMVMHDFISDVKARLSFDCKVEVK